jgi:hypothetical protein
VRRIPTLPLRPARPRLIAFVLIAPLLLTGLRAGSSADPPSSEAPGSAPGFVEAVSPFLQSFCTRCHGPEESEGGLDLVDLLDHARREGVIEDLQDWRTIRDKLRHREMPPNRPEDEGLRPDEGEYAAVLDLLDGHLAASIAALPQEPGAVTARRLNRTEAAATLRDLFGVEVEIERHLPPDDVGEGFDHIGDVLGIPPIFFEKWMGLAEEVARRAVVLPNEDRAHEWRHEGDALEGRGGVGPASGGVFRMYSRSTVSVKQLIPADGEYELGVLAWGEQAGSEPVKLALSVDGERIAVLEVPETRESGEGKTLVANLRGGVREIAVSFINDYFAPLAKDPAERDRNAILRAITVRGPRGGCPPTPFQSGLWPEEPPPSEWRSSLERVLPPLLARVWRRPAEAAEIERLLDLVDEVTPEDANASRHLRTAIVAMLVSPKFILRLEGERDGAPGSVRELDGFERATRLSFFLHGTTPSPALLAAAEAGALDSASGVRRAARRLLEEPGARALSERFVPQWLQFAHLREHSPDRQRFADYDRRLARSFEAETIELFDHVRREERPVQELITADYSFLDARLARHYGIEGVEGRRLRKVPVAHPRGGGLLSHGSVLTATSSPRRTSPVGRGRWLLETLLDSAPPPPPADIGDLPDPGQPGSALPLRAQLAKHRRDPRCSPCHVRMDALGFALEEFDAIGRWRRDDPDAMIDSRGELPDGRIVEGVADLRRVIAEDRGYLRALARNLFVFALGRGLTPEDEPALEALIGRIEGEPTIPALIDEIVGTRAFLERRAPPRAATAREL